MKINKKIKVLDFKLSKILNWGLFGAYKSKFSWNWMEFSEHKEYHFWDHVKNIDWKASSKTWEMYVKKYEEERDLNVLFFLDNTESMSFWSDKITKRDLLIDIFYSLSLSAYYNNDNIWWAIYDEYWISFINYKKSRENIYKIIDILEKEKQEKFNKDTNKINKILDYLVTNNLSENLIFILTDSTEKVNEKLLKLVSNNNDVVIINIFDYFENNLSDLLWDVVLNKWNNFASIDISNEKLEEYKKHRKNQLWHFKDIIEKNKLWYIKIDTKSDILKELMGYFSKVNN
jgi:hypothetical protein